MENSGRRWTKSDEQQLIGMIEKGMPITYIAEQFGRTDKAILARMCLLGYSTNGYWEEIYRDGRRETAPKRTPVVKAKRIVEKKQGFWSRLKEMMS